MTWLFFAVLAGFCFTASGLASRYVLKGNKDAWAFSFYFSAIGAAVSLPFLLTHLKMATSLGLWGLMVLVSLMVVANNLLTFKSTNLIAASVQGSITKFRLVWAFLFGILLLHESFSLLKVVGTILTLAAGILIIRGLAKPQSIRGVLLALLSTMIYATVIVLYKALFIGFNSASLTFFIFLIPAVLNFILMPQRVARIAILWRENSKGVALACVSGGLGNLAMNQALAMGEVSRVLVIIEAFLVITLVGEHFFLRERDHLWIKAVAVLLASAGAILIRLS